MSVSINGTNGLVFSDGTSQNTSPFTGGFQFRNRIMNGDMRIDQRNAGASASNSSGANLDRWLDSKLGSGQYSAQRSTVAPTGFTNSLLHTVTTAVSPAATDIYQIYQGFEGYNVADFNFGTSAASTVTLSFWVRSSIVGTYGVVLRTYTGSRSYVATYSVIAANTWEYKTITIPGDTSGTWVTDNNGWGHVLFDLGSGSNANSSTPNTWTSNDHRRTSGCVNLISTNGATFYITGVQLEKGSTATSFDYRPYGTELMLCQRYYQKSTDMNTAPANNLGDHRPWAPAAYLTGGCAGYNIPFNVVMRAAPTMTAYSALNTNSNVWQQYNGSGWADFNPGLSADYRSWSFSSTYSVVSGRWAASAEI